MVYFDTLQPNKYNFLKKEIFPYKTSFTKKRYGGKNDGSYIFLQELMDECRAVYSFGINTGLDAIGFDLEMADSGKTVFMYDGSIDAPSASHHNFRFTKKFVNKDNLASFIIGNGHSDSNNMALKVDIDGNEYELFNSSVELIAKHFNQISMEIHSLIEEYPPEWKIDDLNLSLMKNGDIKKLFFQNIKKYYNIVHVHANNHSPRYVDFPSSMEILFLRKNYGASGVDNNPSPTKGLDYPNYTGRADYILDWWI